MFEKKTAEPKERRQGPDLPYQKPPNGRIVAQLRYASRLPGDVAGQNYLGGFYYGFVTCEQRNVMSITASPCEKICIPGQPAPAR
ncbi:MAG: hypothetical protein WBP65_09410 [Candidatus Sulfotelmatobacter sp.]|jgi:hypothetical protein